MSDIFVVVMAPSNTMPAAVYGPFETKHKAHLFIEDELGQDEMTPNKLKRAFVVRGYGIPSAPAFTVD